MFTMFTSLVHRDEDQGGDDQLQTIVGVSSSVDNFLNEHKIITTKLFGWRGENNGL